MVVCPFKIVIYCLSGLLNVPNNDIKAISLRKGIFVGLKNSICSGDE